jgi:DNA-binding CsgD family transcriptional regulator
MVAFGVIFLGAKGNIVHMNGAATKILAQEEGLLATPRGLRAECQRESAELEAMIACAGAACEGRGTLTVGSLSISRRVCPPLQLLVSPLREFPISTKGAARTVVFVNDSTKSLQIPLQVLRRLFAFSPAECRVALLLANGKTPPQIASMIGVSTNTLKSQLASIYRKTGISRQAQLARLVIQLGVFAKAPD